MTDERASPRHAIDLFLTRCKESVAAPALRYKSGGTWRTLTFADWERSSREIAAGLRALGIGKGDRVCLLAATRHEWVLADVGILMAGAVTVPIYPSNLPEQCAYIALDSGARAIMVDDATQLAKLFAPDVRVQMGSIPIIVFDTSEAIGRAVPPEAAERVRLLETLRAEGRRWLEIQPGALDQAFGALVPEDLFTIVYTSGTTGPPKGAVLTHGNIVFECQTLQSALELTPADEQLLFLPLAHIFAKILEWMAIHSGSVISFAESMTTIKQDLVDIRPTYMGAVPRVYEKFFAGISAGVKDGSPLKRRIFDWARQTGSAVAARRQRGLPTSGALAFKFRIASRLVYSKLKGRLGLDRMRILVSGGAPLAREIAEFFGSLDLFIYEGYGLTETTAATHVNHPKAVRFGTVGRALRGVEIRLADDGEVLMRGANIMRGYYGKEAETRASIDSDGWFHSGDIGIIEDGFLRITDRKKDIIVTAGGKNVAPQNLECALKARCPYVSQVMVHGDKRNFLSALVTLNEEAVGKWAAGAGLGSIGFPALSERTEVRALVQKDLDALNADLPTYETIKKFAILPKDFSQETGELTPTLKVKRKFASEKYKAILDGFYAQG